MTKIYKHSFFYPLNLFVVNVLSKSAVSYAETAQTGLNMKWGSIYMGACVHILDFQCFI